MNTYEKVQISTVPANAKEVKESIFAVGCKDIYEAVLAAVPSEHAQVGEFAKKAIKNLEPINAEASVKHDRTCHVVKILSDLRECGLVETKQISHYRKNAEGNELLLGANTYYKRLA